MNVEAFYQQIGIELQPIGTRWRAPCPFHKETDPSFVVYPDAGYHCFGCGAHGTAKDLQDHFEIDFRPFPDLTTTKDPILDKLRELKSRLETEIALLVVDVKRSKKFKVYDAFDRLMLDANSFAHNPEINLLDLVAFVKYEFVKVLALTKERRLNKRKIA